MEKRQADKMVGEIREVLESKIVEEKALKEVSKQLAVLQVENIVKSVKMTTAWMDLNNLERSQLSMDYDYWDRIKLEIKRL